MLTLFKLLKYILLSLKFYINLKLFRFQNLPLRAPDARLRFDGEIIKRDSLFVSWSFKFSVYFILCLILLLFLMFWSWSTFLLALKTFLNENLSGINLKSWLRDQFEAGCENQAEFHLKWKSVNVFVPFNRKKQKVLNFYNSWFCHQSTFLKMCFS